MAATELLGVPVSTYFNAGVEVACVVFALSFFKGSRFPFLDGGWIREWSFQFFVISGFQLFLLIAFGMPVLLLTGGTDPQDQQNQLQMLVWSTPFFLAVFGITFLFLKKDQRRRRRSYR